MLRSLIIASCLWPLAAFSEETDIEYAPGSQGPVKAPVTSILRDAKKLGEEWKQQLDIQEPDLFGADLDASAMRQRALNNPRVQALLNAQGQAQDEDDQKRYENKRVFVFVSFSMPPQSLRSVIEEAHEFDATVLFQGFLNNSVFETQNALLQVFGSEEATKGFGIDPTMFVRFGIDRVPAVVVTKNEIEPCETPGCENDVAPIHDKLTGNIPLSAVFQEIVTREGDAAEHASFLLERKRAAEWK